MSKTFDLRTLNLASGDYTITVRARATGLKDSLDSTPASYVLENQKLLKRGTYKMNDYSSISVIDEFSQYMVFSSNGQTFSSITCFKDPVVIKYGDTVVYENGSWVNGNYRDLIVDKDTYINNTAYSFILNGGCFVAGTPVLMADGSTKAIETLVEGDLVLTYDSTKKMYDTGKILKLIIVKTHHIARIGFADGSFIELTHGHPLYIDGVWKTLTKGGKYQTIEIGDKVLSTNGNYAAIVSIEYITLDEPISTYNTEVEGEHNYFVGEAEILAHNAGSK
jgi:hypothetical protein